MKNTAPIVVHGALLVSAITIVLLFQKAVYDPVLPEKSSMKSISYHMNPAPQGNTGSKDETIDALTIHECHYEATSFRHA